MLTIEQIREAIQKACDDRNAKTVPVDADLRELGYDSLDMFNIYLELGEMAGRSIPDEDIERLTSIRAIYDYFNAEIS